MTPFRLAAALSLLSIAPVLAQTSWDGTYGIVTDGGQGTLILQGGQGSISIGAPGCAGGLDGVVSQIAADMLILSATGDAACALTLGLSDGKVETIAEGKGCSFYRGASCGFDGRVVAAPPPGPASSAPTPVPDLSALALKAPARELPFAGVWTCRSDAYGRDLKVILSATAAEVPDLGQTVGITGASRIGGRESAWRFSLDNGDWAAVTELEPARMVLSTSSEVLDCRR